MYSHDWVRKAIVKFRKQSNKHSCTRYMYMDHIFELPKHPNVHVLIDTPASNWSNFIEQHLRAHTNNKIFIILTNQIYVALNENQGQYN